jgi:hypothetical protein
MIVPVITGETGVVTVGLRENLYAVPGKLFIDSQQNITHNTESAAV